MSSAAPQPGGAVKSRRVFHWTPERPPPMADILSKGPRRRAWLKYWVAGKAQDVFDLTMFALCSRLPIDFVSGLGAWLGWFCVRYFKPQVLENARRNFRRLKPHWTETQNTAAVRRLYQHIGRVIAEFACLTRLAPAARIQMVDPQFLLDAVRQGPVIIISLHTGNWEAGAAALQTLGLRWADIYAPPAREVQGRIANRVRETFGMTALPPGRVGVRPAIRHLQQGGCISIFCDEVHHGVVMAPFFDRPPHIDGNLAITARLARMTGAKIIVGQLTRTEGCRFVCTFQPAVTLETGRPTPEFLLRDVVLLNSVIAPIVDANLDQWYFLDNDL